MARRPVTEHVRATSALALGGVAGIAVALFEQWELAVLAGWVVASAVLLASTWFDLAALDAPATQANALREDDSRALTGLLLVVAAVVSLVAVGFGLRAAVRADDGRAALLVLASVLSIGLAWAVVHTVFTLRYAHEYYAEVPGGIDFPGGEAPCYVDFAYFAFGIGMTFQVSDAPVSSAAIRRTVLRHTLLAYLFGTAIIAASINAVAGFL